MAHNPNIGLMLALTIVAVACIILVLAPCYKDNLLQRLGAAFTCFTCVGNISAVYHGTSNPNMVLALILGVLTVVVGTAMRSDHASDRHNHHHRQKGSDHAS